MTEAQFQALIDLISVIARGHDMPTFLPRGYENEVRQRAHDLLVEKPE